MSTDTEKGCSATADWLRQGVREIASQIAIDPNRVSQLDDAAYDAVSQKFLRAVVSGHQDMAMELIDQLSDGDNWLKLILLTAKTLKQDWLDQKLSVSDATQGFWTTQSVFRRMRGRSEGSGFTGLVARTCVFWVQPGDSHTLGAHLMREVFEQAGWSAELLVNDMAETVLTHLSDNEIDILGVSIGCDEHLLGVADLLTEARIRSLNPGLSLMVGGPAIEGNLSQYRFLGADILAKDAESALVQASYMRGA